MERNSILFGSIRILGQGSIEIWLFIFEQRCFYVYQGLPFGGSGGINDVRLDS